MLQLFKNENGYEFSYGERSVQLRDGTIYVDNRDILSTIQILEDEREQQKSTSVILGLEYQGEKYHIASSELQLIALSHFKYLTFTGNNLKNMYCLERDEPDGHTFLAIVWVSPLEGIEVSFGLFKSTITTSQWAIINFGSTDPRTISENTNIHDIITFVGFLGSNSKVWDNYIYPDSPLIEFKVM